MTTLDIDAIHAAARKLEGAMTAANAACGGNAKILLAGGSPAVKQARRAVVDAVKALRPMVNPDGLTIGRAEMRLSPETMTAEVVYGDQENIADAPAGIRGAMATIRERTDTLYAWLAGAAPEGWQLNMRRWLESFRGAMAGMEQQRIPADERTIPMTYRRAARLMGKSGSAKDAAKWLSACVSDGTIRCEHKTRQMHVLSKHDFPREVWPQILPRQSGPKRT